MNTIEDLLSRPRLAPYKAATAGCTVNPLDLYAWNSQIGAAFFESLHYVEVGLRNAIDSALQSKLVIGQQGLSWFDPSLNLLTRDSRDQVRRAQSRIQREGKRVSHGKVIAELSFGFWWSLFAQCYNRQLWQPALQHAFEGSVRRERLHQELNHLRTFRNRIAHHEPVFARDLISDWERLLDLAGRIAPSLELQVTSTTRVPGVLAACPI